MLYTEELSANDIKLNGIGRQIYKYIFLLSGIAEAKLFCQEYFAKRATGSISINLEIEFTSEQLDALETQTQDKLNSILSNEQKFITIGTNIKSPTKEVVFIRDHDDQEDYQQIFANHSVASTTESIEFLMQGKDGRIFRTEKSLAGPPKPWFFNILSGKDRQPIVSPYRFDNKITQVKQEHQQVNYFEVLGNLFRNPLFISFLAQLGLSVADKAGLFTPESYPHPKNTADAIHPLAIFSADVDPQYCYEFKFLGSHGQGDIRLLPGKQVINDNGEVLLIFDKIVDHRAIKEGNFAIQTCERPWTRRVANTQGTEMGLAA